MKYFLLFSINLLLLFSANSQVAQKMNYQAIVRNAQGQPVTNQNVALRFTIHDATTNGTTVFTETQNTTTNQFGLATMNIGNSGNLITVNWGTGDKFLQVEVDATGGTNFTDMGTTQLLTVPYAYYAKDAESVKNAKTLLYLSH